MFPNQETRWNMCKREKNVYGKLGGGRLSIKCRRKGRDIIRV